VLGYISVFSLLRIVPRALAAPEGRVRPQPRAGVTPSHPLAILGTSEGRLPSPLTTPRRACMNQALPIVAIHLRIPPLPLSLRAHSRCGWGPIRRSETPGHCSRVQNIVSLSNSVPPFSGPRGSAPKAGLRSVCWCEMCGVASDLSPRSQWWGAPKTRDPCVRMVTPRIFESLIMVIRNRVICYS